MFRPGAFPLLLAAALGSSACVLNIVDPDEPGPDGDVTGAPADCSAGPKEGPSTLTGPAAPHLVGRFSPRGEFVYSGSRMTARFTGSGVAANIALPEGADTFNPAREPRVLTVKVDGVTSELAARPGRSRYVLAEGLDPTAVHADKRDGKGGFVKNPRALDSFGGADEDITNAYIVYAMTESGYKDLQKELDAVYANAKKTKDAYILALVANSLYNVSDNKRADELMEMLVKKQNDFGYWAGDRHSITRSTGDALKIETTSLVGLAMMKTESSNQMALQNGVRYLVGARNGLGGFGSSQSTILALKALTKYAQYSKKTDESGTVEIYVNDKLVASKAYEKGEKKNVTIDSLQGFFKEGKQKVEVKFKGCKNAPVAAVTPSLESDA